MPKVLGIVAEYNPFHKGHLYHLNKAKELANPDYTIAIMSGHFTQRGEPAILDKWSRCSMALHNGIDLVLELPSLYSCQTAEVFAHGAVSILQQSSVVTHMAFGSEYHNMDVLNTLAQILAEEPLLYTNLLKEYLSHGLSYPHARQSALKEFLDLNQYTGLASKDLEYILRGSNSILSIEYLKALKILKTDIEPIIIPRVGSNYNDPYLKGIFSSATAIRNEILEKGSAGTLISALPKPSVDILKKAIQIGRCPVSLGSFESLLLCLLRRTKASDIADWMDVSEGLENRIKKSAQSSSTLIEFLSRTKTKRYTATRLQRILIHGLLNITHNMVHKDRDIIPPPYIRILGFNTRASKLLSQLKSRATLPLITKPANYHRHKDANINRVFELEILASDLYCLGFPQIDQRKGGQEYVEGPIII